MGGNEVVIGIIGTGHMGSMFATAFIKAGYQGSILIHNRTQDKAVRLKKAHPHQIIVCTRPEDVVDQADYVFLCVKAEDADCVMTKLRDHLRFDQVFLSVISSISIIDMESIVPCKVVKLIPSITQMAQAGVLLVMFGSRLNADDQDQLIRRLSLIGTPHPIDEKDVRIFSDLTSCGPAFLAHWLKQMAEAAAKKGLDLRTAELLLTQMMDGTAKLVVDSRLSLSEIIQFVAAPGGVTRAGLDVLQETQPALFDRLFTATAVRQQQIVQGGHDQRPP